MIAHTGFFRSILFWWLNPLLRLGSRRPLQAEDVFQCPDSHQAHSLDATMQRAWSTEQTSGRRSLARALIRTVRGSVICAVCVKLPQIACRLMAPILMRMLLDFFSDLEDPSAVDPSMGYGIGLMVAFILLPTLASILNSHYYRAGQRCLVDVNTALRCLILRKSLRTSDVSSTHPEGESASKDAPPTTPASTGNVINLMSVDCQQVGAFFDQMHELWSSPVEIVVILVLLFLVLGLPALGGVAMLILMIPLQRYFLNGVASRMGSLATNRDKRVSAINELVQGIRIVKFNAWMSAFERRIRATRNPELKVLTRLTFFRALVIALFNASHILVALITLVWYSLVNGSLPAAVIFPAVALFQLLQDPAALLPHVFTLAAQARVSFRRLHSFLDSEEVDGLDKVSHAEDVSVGSVQVQGASFVFLRPALPEEEEGRYGPTSEPAPAPALDREGRDQQGDDESQESSVPVALSLLPSDTGDSDVEVGSPKRQKNALSEISLQVNPGQLVAVVGRVGCGKSTLLKALFGEVHIVKGSVKFRGKLAYCPQDPWIFNASFRENIVEDEPFDLERYESTLRICELLRDREILAGGDDCELGDNGINISMGQKQRISLARAVYRDADVYLLDSPLSAVDAMVGRSIFSQCILGRLASKTRIMVTHNPGHLSSCDQVICMENGRILRSGTYTEVFQGGFLASMLSQEQSFRSLVAAAAEEGGDPACQPDGGESNKDDQVAAEIVDETEVQLQEVAEEKMLKEDASGTLVVREDREVGQVSGRTVKGYAASFGCLFLILGVLSALGTQGFQVGNDLWLARWIQDSTNAATNQQPQSLSTDLFRGIYIGLAVLACLCAYFRAWSFFRGGIRAAENLHTRMLRSVIRARILFFDTNPVGRIVNRFTRDQSNLEMLLPEVLLWFSYSSMQVVAAAVVVAIEMPWALLSLIPGGLLFYFIQKWYRNSSRELRRLVALSNSPVFDHFSATLRGLGALRAHSLEPRTISESMKRFDQNQKCTYVSNVLALWLIANLSLVVCFVRIGVGILALVLRSSFSAATIGLVLTYTLFVTESLRWAIQNFTDVESTLTSAERMLHFTRLPAEGDNVPQDKDFEESEKTVERADGARVEFHHCDMRYRDDLDLCLRDVCIQLAPGEKVGVIGRTGAGKSSLTMALFRMVEICNGTILVDGRDAQKMDVEELRAGMSIIPQDPVLFSGDIRKNLDPLEEYEDEELWRVLEVAGLAEFVRQQEDGLSSGVAEHGKNLSVGQRQLLCLGRSLLRQTRLLILDEATASLDPESDVKIQNMLQHNFSKATILCIAHRLETISNFDKIVVMDAGRVVEQGSPATLMANPSSHYAQLWQAASDSGLH